MKLTTLFWFFVLAGFLAAQTPQVPIKFDGQIRLRSEADGRDFDSDSDLNTYSLLRTRLGASVSPVEDIRVYVQIQDSRALGTEANTLANSANLDIHQAFFSVSNLWQKPIQLKIGRQEMVYGSQRLIGAVGWSNVGRSFDGIKVTFGTTSTFDLLSMIINESNTQFGGPSMGQDNSDFRFLGAYYKHRKKRDYTLDVYGFFESNVRETVPGKNDLGRVTLGSYNKGSLSSDLDFESEVALQFGKRRGQDVSAFMLTGSVGYTFQTGRKPHVRLGFDYLSGMEQGDDNYKVFDTLFATNHKFYGFMDYFLNLPVHTAGLGLLDLMAKAKLPLRPNLALNAHFHNFRAAKGDEKNFGNELDLVLNYKYNTAASFVLGLSFFLPGDLTELRFGNDDVGVWSYTSFLVKF
ncbi:MAG: alginate export family protein [bacterium]